MNKEWWLKTRSELMHDEGPGGRPMLKVYKCPAGKLTIGWGRNLEDNGISEATALQMLDEDIGKSILAAERIFGRDVFEKWSGPRQRAIVNMIFQLGEHGFIKFTSTVRAIRAGQWELAATHAKDSLWAQQTPNRAKRIITMFLMEYESGDE